MEQPALILDYASPRKRVRLRMPARSVLDVSREAGRITVVETLKGRREAIGAIAFGAAMLIYLCGFMIAGPKPESIIVLAPFWLAEAAVLPLVIHQTWRKTVLSVDIDQVTLRFTSPFTHAMHEWPASEVAEVVTIVTGMTSLRALGELHIQLVRGGEVHLFTDHPEAELSRLTFKIHAVLDPDHATPEPVLPAEPPQPAPDPLEAAQRNTGRLLDVRRALHDKLHEPHPSDSST